MVIEQWLPWLAVLLRAGLCCEQGCAASKAELEPELWQLMLFGGRISMRMGGDE